ncbi:MAG: site-specific DNA-methyltransferase [Candidatus Odinarchaeum yellowstonii]|uniref:site-specific DNA-methyltransferase (cytosine-N(4)-specific) n=1 Tax=Odinarchaeota yellowstonii (strain LCB_4) TaxID=1841599 RepID=A0AAF0D3D5_ODILC|nr:MAG: site-specific DNA-methyltransferase [Candidatus Odinarchaeum yellowstonii]
MVNCLYFKLFDNIKSEHEAGELARLELESLFGEVTPIKNFYDSLAQDPLKLFTGELIRIQDIILHELPYGVIQGYQGFKNQLIDLTPLVKRLAYTREIFLITDRSESSIQILQKIFPDGVIGKNVQYFEEDDKVLFRFITNQYFLEKSFYISKLSRNEVEIDRNVEILFSHLNKNIYRIPSSVTLNVGKRLEDYFSIREEPSLYLNHYMHPYKGKFHPKMVRALLNYVCPQQNGKVMDNFAGSGTLLVEAQYLGLDSLGAEINPLSVLMCNVKCQCITINLKELKLGIQNYLNLLDNNIKYLETSQKGQSLLTPASIDFNKIRDQAAYIIKKYKERNNLKESEFLILKILVAKETLQHIGNQKMREFLLLAISGAVSDLARRTKNDFRIVLEKRISDLYLRLYLFHQINRVLKIKLGESVTYISDTRALKEIPDESIDGIITSPPYSTALDYIKNDYPQLIILGLAESIERLEEAMIGNPNVNYDRKQLLELVRNPDKDPLKTIPLAHKYVDNLLKAGRVKEALRQYKFYIDMEQTLKEMRRVLKPKAKAAIIIGDNHFLIDNQYIAVPNDQIIQQIAQQVGYKIHKTIERPLQKTSVGNIREETILILEKD